MTMTSLMVPGKPNIIWIHECDLRSLYINIHLLIIHITIILYDKYMIHLYMRTTILNVIYESQL